MSYGCCLQEAALNAVGVPIFTTDGKVVVWANASACSLVADEGGEELIGLPIDQLISPDIAPAATQRRQLMIDHGTVFSDVVVKFRCLDGTLKPARAHMQAADVCGGRLVIQAVWQVDDRQFAPQPSSHAASKTVSKEYRCVHRAAFDLLPVPLMLHTRSRVVKANDAARRKLRASSTLDAVLLSTLMHPDFVPVAAERNAVLFDRGAGFFAASAKLSRMDGTSIHAVMDGYPIDYSGERFALEVVRETRNID